jgi:hypothetical protein
MKIPLTRRIAYWLLRFTRVVNLSPYRLVKRLNGIKAPEHAVDPETEWYGFSDEDLTAICDFVLLRSGLGVTTARYKLTSAPEIFSLTLYVAPLNYHPSDLSFLLDDDSPEAPHDPQ